MEETRETMQQFLECFKDHLETELKEKTGLVLLRMEMVKGVTTGEDKYPYYTIGGLVVHPLTQAIHEWRINVGGVFGKTEPADVMPLVIEVVEKLRQTYYE